jgi:hypothetical protein
MMKRKRIYTDYLHDIAHLKTIHEDLPLLREAMDQIRGNLS